MVYKNVYWIKMAQARVQRRLLASIGSKKGRGTTTSIFKGGTAPCTTCNLTVGTSSFLKQKPMAFLNTQNWWQCNPHLCKQWLNSHMLLRHPSTYRQHTLIITKAGSKLTYLRTYLLHGAESFLRS